MYSAGMSSSGGGAGRQRGFGSGGGGGTGLSGMVAAANRQRQVINMEEWTAKLKAVNISKEDMNELVMDYLVIEGYKDVAEKFQQESGTQPQMPLESITDRMTIRADMLHGDVAAAVDKVTQLDANLLESNPDLSFHIRQQQLIELIRKGGVEEALAFAQEKLAPCGERNPQYLEELERTMALLLFSDWETSPSAYASLMATAQRQKTAGELNAAILASLKQNNDPKLLTLLKMVVWLQEKFDAERMPSIPKMTDLGSASFQDSTTSSSSSPATPTSQ